MFIIVGATGNVGSQVVKTLAKAGQPVLAVVHSAGKADAVKAHNIEAVVTDLNDSAALRNVFRRGNRAFLLNPPGDPSGDSNAQDWPRPRALRMR